MRHRTLDSHPAESTDLSTRDDIIAHHAAGKLLQLFVERISGHRRDEDGKAFLAELVELHNTGVIDVLEPARSIATYPLSTHEFFLVQSVYVDVIPTLQAEVPAMLAAVKALVARAGDDLASGRPNGAFRLWAENSDRARALLALADPGTPDDAAYIYLGLLALSKTEPEVALDRAITLLASRGLAGRLGAAKALGTLPLGTVEARSRSLDSLEAAHRAGADDNLLGHIIAAAVDIVRSVPTEEAKVVKLIDAIAADAGDQSIHHAVSTLMFHADDLAPAIVIPLTRIAHKTRIENIGTLDRLDGAAAQFLSRARVDEALALVVPLLTAHEELSSLEKLDSFAHGLLGLDGERLARIIVTWLLSLNQNLGEAARSLVGNSHRDPIILEFDADALALPEEGTIVLAHRAIGFLFMYPITAASMILSLVRTASAEGCQLIEEILFEPLLINFSGELANWLKAKAADETDPTLPTIKRLLTRLEDYLEGVRRVGRINELRPSERERLIESHRQQESMRQAHKEAEKRSVFLSIVSRSVILYGIRSISYFQGLDGKKQRNEMKLHSFSHSFEAPRLDIIEPFELDYTLRVFRAMKEAP